MKEIWKSLEFIGLSDYSVSNTGKIKNHITNKVFYGHDAGYGYYTFKNHRIHRLVAEAFIPNPDNKPFVDHINGIKNDNRASNLRWCTSLENMSNPLTKAAVSLGRTGIRYKSHPLSEEHKEHIREAWARRKNTLNQLNEQ